MELIDAIKKRRSVRKYDSRIVTHDAIEKVLKAAQMAPVSCNLQLTQYVVVEDERLLKKLSEKVSYKFGYAPVMVVVLVDSRYTVERESAVMTAGMAVQNMMLRATDLGLSTCPMAGFGKDEVIKEILNIPEYMDIQLVVSLGYQDDSEVKESVTKLPIGETYKFNSYNGLKTINPSDKLEDHTPESIRDYRDRISTVYLDRFRLLSFSQKYYKKIIDEISKILPRRDGNWLDLMSYDGEFLRQAHENENYKDFVFNASDYLKSSLSFLAKTFNIDSYLINENNELVTDKKFNHISFIFGLDFTPAHKDLLSSAISHLEDDGYIYISVVRNRLYKAIILWLKELRRKLKGKITNIYEGNIYYKIGPRKEINLGGVKTLMQSNGLKLMANKSFSFNKNGVILKLLVFKKD